MNDESSSFEIPWLNSIISGLEATVWHPFCMGLLSFASKAIKDYSEGEGMLFDGSLSGRRRLRNFLPWDRWWIGTTFVVDRGILQLVCWGVVVE